MAFNFVVAAFSLFPPSLAQTDWRRLYFTPHQYDQFKRKWSKPIKSRQGGPNSKYLASDLCFLSSVLF